MAVRPPDQRPAAIVTEALQQHLRFFDRKRIRIQYQTEAAECGLACLAMIMSFHGNRTEMSKLRQRWPVSLKGLTLVQLMDMASDVKMTARPLRLAVNELTKLRTPCILHWRLDHFVVLEKARRSGIKVIDPAVGRQRLSYVEVSKWFSGVAVELAPASEFTKVRKQHQLASNAFSFGHQGHLQVLVAIDCVVVRIAGVRTHRTFLLTTRDRRHCRQRRSGPSATRGNKLCRAGDIRLRIFCISCLGDCLHQLDAEFRMVIRTVQTSGSIAVRLL